MIVGFLSVLLIFLNESEAYTLTAKLLIYSRQDKEKSLRKHFMCTKAEHKNLVEVTIKIIRRDMRGLVTFLDTQNFDLNKLVSDMLTSFFVGYFRISSLTRVLTCFLSEGSKSLVRVIYGIFNSLQRELPYRQEQIEVYIKNQCCYLTSVDELLRMGFRAKINRAEYALEQPEPESHSEHLRDLFRLSIHMNSQIISVHYFDLIRSHIPTNFRNLAPKMILTNQEEKTDLRELVLRASRYPLSTAMLFIILTATGEIFGAFIDRIIEFSKKQLPISNSFIFVLEPEPKFYHANQHESFAIITKRELSLGKSEEGAALLIDGKLKNFNSISSKMYKNPSFGCRSFDIKIFESFVLQ